MPIIYSNKTDNVAYLHKLLQYLNRNMYSCISDFYVGMGRFCRKLYSFHDYLWLYMLMLSCYALHIQEISISFNILHTSAHLNSAKSIYYILLVNLNQYRYNTAFISSLYVILEYSTQALSPKGEISHICDFKVPISILQFKY